MKHLIQLFSILFLIVVFASCSNQERYSELQKKETNQINDFIAMNKIKVVNTIPKTWDANTYYLSPSGLYINIENVGDSTIALNKNSKTKVGFRTLEYELNEAKTVVSDKRSANAYPYPIELLYGDSYYITSLGSGLYEAIGIMKNLDSKANLIVPSNLNTTTYSNSLIPRGYEVIITVIN